VEGLGVLGGKNMKRSEIIDHIAATLIITNIEKDEKLGDLPIHIARKYAEAVLDDIEKQGMKPPFWIPKDHGYVISDEPTGEPNGFNFGVYKWEPEDEEE
jgi:ribose 5-phosphate isomerase